MQHCKIGSISAKDSSLSFELKIVELTKINKIGRTIVNIKQRLRKVVNAPDRTRIITLSGHLSGGAKKETKDRFLQLRQKEYYSSKEVQQLLK